jgi:outer membrane protein OmpA-like peptidoglycan-associated protein
METIYFGINSQEINIDGQNLIMRIARILSVSKGKINLSGHADKTGEENKNVELSRKRAEKVKEYFISLGVNPQSVETQFYGDKKPLVEGEAPEIYAKNRRVEITLTADAAGLR